MGRRKKKCPDCGKLIRMESAFCTRCCKKGSRNGKWAGGISSHGKCVDCEIRVNRRSTRCVPCHALNSTGKNNANWRGGVLIGGEGYRKVLVGGHPHRDCKGYVLEHRLVMEKKIGRYLTKEENVHHMNGVKGDNRVENLELWTRPQPSGVRVSDEIERCIKFLEKYNIKVQEENHE